MRKILRALLLSFALASPAEAGPGAEIDAVNAAQDAAIADGLDEVRRAIADVARETDALKEATDSLTIRVEALEDGSGGGGGDPDPDPNPDPDPDPTPEPDPAAPSISIDVTPLATSEGSTYLFTLTRTGDVSAPSSVAYDTFGIAEAADFEGGVAPSGAIAFADGEGVATLRVTTRDDDLVEGDELFGLTLSAPVGATIGVGSASATIIDNDSAPDPNPDPGPDPGRGAPIQLGLGHHWPAQGENPYVNQTNYFNGGMFADQLNPQTGDFTVKPGQTFTLGQIRPLQNQGAPQVDAGQWLVKWTTHRGVCNITAPGLGAPTVSGAVSRATIDLAADDTSARQLKVSGDCDGRIDYVGMAQYENSASPWHPKFIAYAHGYDVLRFMDWVGVINSTLTRADQWVADGAYIPQQRGYRLDLIADLARRADTAVHLNVPLGLGAAVIESELGKTGAEIKAAVAANWPAIRPEIEPEAYKLAKRVFAALNAVGYSKPLYIEPGNEIWNGNFGRTNNYARGVGQAENGRENAGGGAGYLSARIAAGFERARRESAPSMKVYYVIGCHTALTSAGNFCVEALNSFTAAGGPVADLFIGTTGYFGGGVFKWAANKDPTRSSSYDTGNPWGAKSEAEHFAAFKASYESGRLPADAKRWNLDPASTFDSVANSLRQHDYFIALGKKYAAAGVLQYEGSNHGNKVNNSLLAAYPLLDQAFHDYQTSPEAEQVQAYALKEYAARGVAVRANYFDVAKRLTTAGPWAERSPTEIDQCAALIAAHRGGAAAWCAEMRP